MDSHLVLTFVVATALLSLAPGPDLLFIVTNGIVGGRRAGVLAALGMSTGLAVHTVIAATGLGVLIEAAPQVLQAVRLAGAAVLIVLAVSAWRSGSTSTSVPAAPRRSLGRTYAMALLTNLANPKVILFYLALFPQFLATGPSAWSATVQMLTLGAIFIIVGLTIDATAGMISGALADRILTRPAVRKVLHRAAALVFGGLAARLVLDSR